MKFIKKLPRLLLCALLLAASIPLYALAADEVNILAKIWPKTGMALNFDSVSFEGDIDQATNAGTFKKGDETVSQATLTVRYKDNYKALISGTDFADTKSLGKKLKIDRLTVLNNGTPTTVTTTPTEFSSGSSSTGASNANVELKFNLDLSQPEGDKYKDNAILSGLNDTTEFKTKITLSLSGM